ncbi:hypothetical protein [Streptomyces sp. NPDC056323]|uniref:hypothetical protein n=1 Tax=Streptomyces sp. NPDC056323 TaxID=3345784 RepID=UPI0035DF0575
MEDFEFECWDCWETNYIKGRLERKRLKDPSDRTGWLRLAANRTASADAQDAVAQVYDELVTAEPALAEEHRASADTLREYAQGARDYAELALEQAGKL